MDSYINGKEVTFDLMEDLLKAEYDHIKPKAYQFTVKGVEMDILDVIQALNLSFDSGSIMKYIARSGKKPNEEETKELRKIIEFAERKIQFINAQ